MILRLVCGVVLGAAMVAVGGWSGALTVRACSNWLLPSVEEISQGASAIFLGRVTDRTVMNPGLDLFTIDVSQTIRGDVRPGPLTLDDFSTGNCEPDLLAHRGNRVIVALEVPNELGHNVGAYWDFRFDGSLPAWSTGGLHPTPKTLDGVLEALGAGLPDTDVAPVARGSVPMPTTLILASILGFTTAVLVGRRQLIRRDDPTRRPHRPPQTGCSAKIVSGD